MKLPHPFVLLLGAVGVAVAMTWVVPAGRYERAEDPITGRELVVPGTYARVDPSPVGLMGALLSVPRGVVEGADVMLVVLVVGGAFGLLEATGALGRLVASLIWFARRRFVVVALISLAFATLGALENMHEEIIALVPVMLVLSRGLGFGAITALAMSIGAAVVGSAFGPTNPFQTQIALKAAGVTGLTAPTLRFGMLAAAVAIWIAWTLFMTSRDDVRPEVTAPAPDRASARDGLLLAVVLVPFIPYVIGTLNWDWGFNELSALFLVAGFGVGLISGLNLSQTATSFLKAMEGMLAAGLFIGVARAISLVLADGQILDTILHALATPLAEVPGYASVALMVPFHTALHIPVPSMSGHAVLTMPIMAPLCDLIGRSRDAAVIAYQTGAGLSDMLVPTNGALLAMLLAARVSYGRWLRFAIPGALLVALVGFIGLALAG
jgi:uncharacterized ion transporter superfamily protein YfcC